MRTLALIGNSVWYWMGLMVFSVSMLAVALFYQYALDHQPCLLCIHVRILVVALLLISWFGLVVRRLWIGPVLAHLLVLVTAAAFFDRAWKLLGIEHGTYLADCSFDLGMPAWLALDRWFPALFKVQEACGYTPELLFGITMAEALVVVAGILLLSSLLFFLASLVRNPARDRN